MHRQYLYHGRHRKGGLGWITRTIVGVALLFAVAR